MCENLRAFHLQTVSFRHWAWYEWVTAVVFFILLIYSVIGIIVISIALHTGRIVLASPEEHTLNQTEKIDPDTLVQPSVETYVLSIFLGAHIFLLITTCLVLIWLKYLRNICVFLVIFVILILTALLFITVGALSLYLKASNVVGEAVYEQVLKNMDTYNYVFRFWAFQDEYDCCGVRGYKDWEELRNRSSMTVSPNSVPDSCCKDHINREDCGRDILSYAENSENIQKINTEGCLVHLEDGFRKDYKLLAIIAFVVAGILLGLIILLLYICHRLYLQLLPHGRRRSRHDRGGRRNDETGRPERDDVNANNNRIGMTGDTASNISKSRGVGGLRMSRSRGRDREDDHESYIVPGTPAKSMISDDEQTFYAP